jgi:hypothetical protein
MPNSAAVPMMMANESLKNAPRKAAVANAAIHLL